MTNKNAKVAFIVTALIGLVGWFLLAVSYAGKTATPEEVVPETEVPTVEVMESADAEPIEYVYPICDVVSVSAEDGSFICECPDGTLQEFHGSDLPYDMELACFQVTDLEDYNTWVLVGAR